MTEYEYFIHTVTGGLTPDQGDELWRLRDGAWDYLSLVDWQWHSNMEPAYEILPRNLDSLAKVTAERAAELEAGQKELLRYWQRIDPDIAVYRTRRLPWTDEIYGLKDAWSPSNDVGDFLYGDPTSTWDLTEIDVATADRIILETRGVAGATEL